MPMSDQDKLAKTDVPVHPLIAARWSPYCYSDKPVSEEDLRAVLEAARWAPSSYNEQPWRYMLARRSDGAAFDQMLSCLVEGNQAWAKAAPVLMIGVVVKTFSRNGKPNRAAEHDLGLAAGNICAEATARGLYVHQMIGIVPERVRELYGVPTEAEPLTALAIGYLGDGSDTAEAMRERDRAPRTRHRVDAFVFAGAWGNAAGIAKS
jgi:nitroreductase